MKKLKELRQPTNKVAIGLPSPKAQALVHKPPLSLHSELKESRDHLKSFCTYL
jgi:hypothetical protein